MPSYALRVQLSVRLAALMERLQPRAAHTIIETPRASPRSGGRRTGAACCRRASRRRKRPRGGPRRGACSGGRRRGDAGERPTDSVAAPAPAGGRRRGGREYSGRGAPAGGGSGPASMWWPRSSLVRREVNAFDGTKLYEITADGSLWDEDRAERRWELVADEMERGRSRTAPGADRC